MKKAIALLLITGILFASCAPKHVPPGQAKKVTGSKSAKPYAPGQQKKN
jgi:hypothetical protein